MQIHPRTRRAIVNILLYAMTGGDSVSPPPKSRISKGNQDGDTPAGGLKKPNEEAPLSPAVLAKECGPETSGASRPSAGVIATGRLWFIAIYIRAARETATRAETRRYSVVGLTAYLAQRIYQIILAATARPVDLSLCARWLPPPPVC